MTKDLVVAQTLPPVAYDHSGKEHSLSGPEAALPILLHGLDIKSLLDVGCGRGTWLRAAAMFCIEDILGVDGVAIAERDLLFPKNQFIKHDLRSEFDLKRKFDLVICLEVAEHLPEGAGGNLIKTLVRHSNRVLFSAACPNQPGQAHMNCRWPEYWQNIFNHQLYACSDWPRWRIWNDARIEPWYRQNMFFAELNAASAGKEQRIRPVIHPEYLRDMASQLRKEAEGAAYAAVKTGALSGRWYMKTFSRILFCKIVQRLRGIPNV